MLIRGDCDNLSVYWVKRGQDQRGREAPLRICERQEFPDLHPVFPDMERAFTRRESVSRSEAFAVMGSGEMESGRGEGIGQMASAMGS